MDRNDLTQGSIWKKMLGFMFPVMLGMLLQQMYHTADAIIVGKLVGKDALAAVGGSPTTLLNLVIGFFSGLGAGTTVIVSQCYGARDKEGLQRTIHTAIAFSLIIGLVLTGIGEIFAVWALKAMDTPPDILDISVVYLRVFLTGTVFNLIYNVGAGILRAMGDSRRPLYYMIIACVFNIVLDLFMVGVLKMGVAGAGWASVITLGLSALLVFLALCRSKGDDHVSLRRIRVHWNTLKDILRIGVPAGFQNAMYGFSNLIIQVGINRLGTTVVAAWSATSKIDGLFWALSSSIGTTICAFVGQCFGAQKYDRMKQGVRKCFFLAEGITFCLIVLMLTFSRFAFGLLTDAPEVIDIAVQIFWHIVPFYLIWSVIEVLSGTLRGAGDAVRPTIIVCVGVCVLRVLWMLLVVPRWNNVNTISISYPISWTITSGVLALYYFKSNWLHRCIRQR